MSSVGIEGFAKLPQSRISLKCRVGGNIKRDDYAADVAIWSDITIDNHRTDYLLIHQRLGYILAELMILESTSKSNIFRRHVGGYPKFTGALYPLHFSRVSMSKKVIKDLRFRRQTVAGNKTRFVAGTLTPGIANSKGNKENTRCEECKTYHIKHVVYIRARRRLMPEFGVSHIAQRARRAPETWRPATIIRDDTAQIQNCHRRDIPLLEKGGRGVSSHREHFSEWHALCRGVERI